MSEPAQKPGKSRQTYATPDAFMDAVARKFGRPDFDLAASADNAKAERFFTELDDALKQDWADVRNANEERASCLWLNPPFANIDPWARKVSECRDLPRWTLMLVPASIDAHWYRDHILGKTMVWGIPRIQFVDTTASYPKALMLIGAGFGVVGNSYWQWNERVAEAAE